MIKIFNKLFLILSLPAMASAHMPGFSIGPGGVILLVTYYYTLIPSAIIGFVTWLVLLISFRYHKKDKAGRKALKIGLFVFLGGLALGVLYSLGLIFFAR